MTHHGKAWIFIQRVHLIRSGPIQDNLPFDKFKVSYWGVHITSQKSLHLCQILFARIEPRISSSTPGEALGTGGLHIGISGMGIMEPILESYIPLRLTQQQPFTPNSVFHFYFLYFFNCMWHAEEGKEKLTANLCMYEKFQVYERKTQDQKNWENKVDWLEKEL